MFSYDEYRKILDIVKSSGKQATFKEALTKEAYIIMRHDVEFSVERAYNLACFEKENHFCSAYFLQVSNNAYNLLAGKNVTLVKKMHDMGHTIGLHFHLNDLNKKTEIEEGIREEIEIMNAKLSFRIDVFSIHRPPLKVLEYNIKIPGILNAYQDEFFSCVENIQEHEPEIKYLSDARHTWNYGLVPDQETLCNNAKVQILTHPYMWNRKGYDNLNNFRTLYAEKCQEIFDTFDSECRHFGEIKNEL